MAKATKASGPSFTEHELSDPRPPEVIRVHRAMLGGEPQSVGDNSQASLESESNEKDWLTPVPQAPARTTENPSDQQELETDSSVSSTDTDGQKTTKTPSAKPKPPPAKKATGRARVRSATETESTDDEFDVDF